MRHAIVWMIVGIMGSAWSWAGPVRLDQIPSVAEGFVHVDLNALIASRIARQLAAQQNSTAEQMALELKRFLGAGVEGVTGYSASGDPAKATLLLYVPDAADRQRLEAFASASPGAVTFNYQQQKVHFSPQPFKLSALENPTTAPADGANEPSHPSRGRRFAFGLGFSASSEAHKARGGPSFDAPGYVALVAPDLIIFTADLKSMADAIDVVAGRKPSLAKEDPQNLKADLRTAALITGAGLAVSFRADAGEPPNRAKPDAPSGALSMDLFSPLQGKARSLKFSVWEDQEAEHIDLSVGMTDVESAEQLKNLMMGVKALLYLTRSSYRDLIDPLEVQSGKMQVNLKWSVSIAKLMELYRNIDPESNHERAEPGNNPASQPTH